MKSKQLISLLMAASPLAALAIPATPEPVIVSNPDGTKIEVRGVGDENFHYITDIDSKFLLQRDARGFWQPITIDGRKLTTSPQDVQLLRSTMPGQLQTSFSAQRAPSRMAELASDGRTTYTTKGEVHSLVILVQYPDLKFNSTDPRADYNDLCNKPGYNDYGSCGSVSDYFKAVSNNQFQPKFDVYGPVTLKNGHAYYSSQGGSDLEPTRDRFYELVYEAVMALDGEIDYSKYDLDGNGTIDNIFFYYAGNGRADTLDEQYIWPHQGNYQDYVNFVKAPQLEVDGVKMCTYACGNEIKGYDPTGMGVRWRDGIGTFCHEFSHVLGLPDMYDTLTTNTTGVSTTKTPGKFDIMDSGPYNKYATCPPGYSAYERWLCNWLELTDVEDGQHYTLNPLSFDDSTPQAYRIKVKRDMVRYYDEFFVIESRDSQLWDSTIPERGMFIWRINFDKKSWASNQPNVNDFPRIEMVQSSTDFMGNKFFAYTDATPYNIPGFEFALTPQNNLKVPFVAWITDISFNEETAQAAFDFNAITEMPTVTTKLNFPNYDEDDHNLYFSWAPVEGAKDYRITITNTDQYGKVRYIDNCNERSTAGETTWSVYGLTPTVWQRNCAAYVRVVTSVPSTEVSNKVEFVPAELSGVENISSDFSLIYGDKGFIHAPENAQIFNLSGVKVENANLPAGLYMVVANGNTYKVLVK